MDVASPSLALQLLDAVSQLLDIINTEFGRSVMMFVEARPLGREI
jgi:hypothetical protein